MPGFASWRKLYAEEHRQMTEEGYPVQESAAADPESLPSPDGANIKEAESASSEQAWEAAYHKLWSLREKGIRPDFPFHEPVSYDDIITSAPDEPVLAALDDGQYANRVKGAWFGRCAAVVLGKPLEMEMDRHRVRQYLESVDCYPLAGWVPARSEKLGMALREDCLPSTLGNITHVQPDDDVHYTVLALLLAEKKGPGFTPLDVGMNWLDNIPYHWFWCASRQIYYHMVNMTDDRSRDEQAGEMNLRLNPWRECIDGQLRGDLWGYVNPASPRAAARYAYKDCSLSLVKNGVYGGMFVAGCVSAALSKKPTVETILQGGLSVIPVQSRLADAVHKVTAWYAEDRDWIKVCDKIYAEYGRLPFAATINNLSIVTLSLLHGNLDYSKTITTAVMAGLDTDCNAGTAGSIIGTAVGFEALGPQWVEPLCDRVKTNVADFGEGTLSALAERTILAREKFRL
jgi:hypothetical protein